MYSLAFLVVEFQNPRRKLLRVFEIPNNIPNGRFTGAGSIESLHPVTKKIQKPIHTNLIRQLILTFAVMCSMAFAACSDLNGTPQTHATVGFQSAVTGKRQTGDNVTIAPRTYNSETESFDRPWPFGPESSPQ
jgi:hypothetical protein